MIDFAKELNSEQLDVVLHGDGPCLVLAGAGSGKTRAITYRVAYLIEKGVSVDNILLVTFTNKAAAEMKERVKVLTGQESFLPWSGTFHHIAYRILKQYAPLLGYGNNFSVLDSDDSESLIKICIKEFRPDSTKRFPTASSIASVISFSRNAEMPISKVVEERYEHWLPFLPEIGKISVEYEKRKREANAMDFDDLLINLSSLLDQSDVVRKFSNQFKFILVDEYQDTNTIQASIVRKLSAEHKNILVVGDDAQSIYSFRAATIENILRFEKDYPGAKIFKLETNYRSSEEIVSVANSVIENNREQYKKQLRTILKGEKPGLFPQLDQQSEGQFVASKIEEFIKNGMNPKEIAVLFRASHHSQMLEVELVRRGIEYDYRGGVRFFERSHIKDVLAYLRIFSNLSDAAAWMRVLMHEEGVGPAAAQKVINVLKGFKDPKLVAEAGSSVLSGKALAGFENFLTIWTKLNSSVMTPSEMIDALVNSSYRDYLDIEFVDSKERLQDIKQLALFAENYEDVADFLANTTLQESFALPKAGEKKTDKVILTTVHQAKGLEWQVVFVINLSAGAFPSDRSMREPKGLEEERRLFYVAVTRAKRQLFLTYPMAGGAFGDFLSGPSLFLDEIAPELLDDHSLLSTDVTVLNDPSADIQYIPEGKPKKIKPGSFLIDIDDL